MKLDDFKLQSEAEDSYHLVHPSGKTFTVQKKGLNEKALSKIKKMSCGGSVQKMADGGTTLPEEFAPIRPGPGMSSASDAVPDYRYTPDQVDLARDAVSQVLPTAPSPIDPAQAAMAANEEAHVTSGIGASSAAAPIIQTPDTVSHQEVPIQAAIPTPQSSRTPVIDPMVASFDKSQGAVQNYLKQINSANGVAAGAQADLAKQLQNQKTPDQIFQEYKAKDDQLMQHYVDQKIDPNRYLANRSSGSKILSFIGIALSGLGAGAHGQNLALAGINKAIENDIKAQESEQGKAMNLLKLNRERTHDEMQAKILTQNQLLTGVQAKIAMAAAQSQNAQANLQGQMMIQQIEQQKNMRRYQLSLMGGGGPDGMNSTDPALLVQNSPMSAAASPAMKEKALAEIEARQNTAKQRDQILAAFDRAAIPNHLKDYIPGASNADQKALHALMGPTFADVEGTVRQAAMDNMAYNTTPNPLSDTAAEIATKRKALIGYLDSKEAAPNFKAVTGMDLGHFASTTANPVGRFTPQEQQYYAFAKANPTNPVSIAFLKKKGLL